MRNIIIIVISIFFISCEKEDFPRKKELIGTWNENTNNVYSLKLIFNNEFLYLTRGNSIDTFNYDLDDENELLKLWPKDDFSANGSSHRIKIKSSNKELIVYGLNPGIDVSIQQFKKK